MPNVRSLPGMGLTGGWNPGQDNWGGPVNLNLMIISVLLRGEVLSRTTNLPANPNYGEVYIVPSGAGSNPNQIAVRDNPTGTPEWVYIPPARGMTLRVRDSQEYVRWTGSTWTLALADSQLLPPTQGSENGIPRVNSAGTGIDYIQLFNLFPTGAANRVLARNATNNDFEWIDPSTLGLPSFTGNQLRVLRVNAGETAAEWWQMPEPGGPYPVEAITGDPRVLSETDADKFLEQSGPDPVRVLCPVNASVAITTGHMFNLTRLGPGDLFIEADAGVTINGQAASEWEITAPFGGATLYKRSTNAWVLQGQVEEVGV